MRQTEIANAIHATQARVSQVLAETDRDGLTLRTAAGWQVTDPAAVFDLCTGQPLRPLPPLGWYALEPGLRQVESSIDAATRARAEYRLTGDWAADLLAPWRIPQLVVLHVDKPLDLEDAGFVPAELTDATLHLVVGTVPPRWRTDPRIAVRMADSEPGRNLAPVNDIARRIRVTGGPDAAEAVAELRHRFLQARRAVESESPRI